MTEPHHLTEAGILLREFLLREFSERGFDCKLLGERRLFQIAMSEYGECKISFDALLDIAEKMAT